MFDATMLTTLTSLQARAAMHQAAATLLNNGAKTATAYVNEKLVVRVARRTYRRKYRGKPVELSITIGRPNYSARKFIKQAKAAGEPFPIKKVQLTFQRTR